MREIAIRVPADAVEGVLDRLLPLVPGGVRELPEGDDVQLLIRGHELPSRPELERAAGHLRREIVERAVSDDWRERRLADYQPLLIGGRLLVAPEWAPAAPASCGPDSIEIVLSEDAAFGVGTHPTTYTCLELLLELEPQGAFADLGCGTGVLAILAAKLGWEPVRAIDLQPAIVAAAAANARRNSVMVATGVGDVRCGVPATAGLAANVPASVHVMLAAGLARPLPRVALLSGFKPAECDGVLESYRTAGLQPRIVQDRAGWIIAMVTADS
jgi:ribosomal protein L11 methyltransferase